MQILPALLLTYPQIDPVIFEIPEVFGLGPFAIRWYAIAYIAGILLGWWYAVRLSRSRTLWTRWGGRPPMTDRQIDDFIVWVTLGIILGGRIGYILFYGMVYQPEIYGNPANWIRIWEGGMSFHGGLIGVIVAIVMFSILARLDMVRVGDLVASVVPIGLFFGRIANFVNGELWGKPADVPWAMVFPHAGPEPRHPSQLYEALLEGVVLFLILRLLATRFRAFDRPGAIISAFLFFYGLFRIVGEIYRESDQLIGDGTVSMGQALSAAMFAGAAFFAWWAWRHRPAPA
ncbi:MAG: prolipoprotein diacylglyceryl transferase [Alphaproteobacteria bacterium]|nr:prolipoprotein diacylglyceryl transferase [Alphaproteobacteria bacterium]